MFVRKAYVQRSPRWDHDHCVFCWAEFMPEGATAHEEPTYREGYATSGPPADPKPDYYWVCPACFADFRDRLDFRQLATDG